MSAISREAVSLIRSQRWAALATLDDGAPLASMVAYAIEPESHALVFFLSQLAAHTRALVARPAASLVVAEPDTGEGDPQRLQRLTLSGTARVVAIGDARHLAVAEAYLARFPEALPRFELEDFLLFEFVPTDARYVGGFARAARFAWTELWSDVSD